MVILSASGPHTEPPKMPDLVLSRGRQTLYRVPRYVLPHSVSSAMLRPVNRKNTPHLHVDREGSRESVVSNLLEQGNPPGMGDIARMIQASRTARLCATRSNASQGFALPVMSDDVWKRRVEQVTGLPFAFELAVA